MMKTILAALFLLTPLLHAEFRVWTNQAGKTTQLDLQKVSEENGVKIGHFKTANGLIVKVKSSDLSAADATALNDWKDPAAQAAEVASVYDKALEKNLVILSGKRFKKLDSFVKPSKYYLFYYTASWCGPCHRFTPELVKFYNLHKPKHPEFETILITNDSDEASMLSYAVEAKMPWPQLELRKAKGFQEEFNHPGRGIPNLVLTDPQGKILKSSYENGEYIGPSAVLEHLAKLFKKQ